MDPVGKPNSPETINGWFVASSATKAAFSDRKIVKKNPIFDLSSAGRVLGCSPFGMKADIHPKYKDAEIRCACGNVIKTRSVRPVIVIGICNACHPFYTGTQKFVDTAGRVDKFQQRLAKTQAAQAVAATLKKKKKR